MFVIKESHLHVVDYHDDDVRVCSIGDYVDSEGNVFASGLKTEKNEYVCKEDFDTTELMLYESDSRCEGLMTEIQKLRAENEALKKEKAELVSKCSEFIGDLYLDKQDEDSLRHELVIARLYNEKYCKEIEKQKSKISSLNASVEELVAMVFNTGRKVNGH